MLVICNRKRDRLDDLMQDSNLGIIHAYRYFAQLGVHANLGKVPCWPDLISVPYIRISAFLWLWQAVSIHLQ